MFANMANILIILTLLCASTTLILGKPELYKENEDFQYSRSSSDAGKQSGYYSAQHGNMRGNFEKSENMDNLAKTQLDTSRSHVSDAVAGIRTQPGASVYGSALYHGNNAALSNTGFVHSADYHKKFQDQFKQTASNYEYGKGSGYSGANQYGANSGQFGANQLSSGYGTGTGYGATNSGYRTSGLGYGSTSAGLGTAGYGSNYAASQYGSHEGYNKGSAISSQVLIPTIEKNQEHSYKYHKEWEKHNHLDASPAPLELNPVPLPVPGYTGLEDSHLDNAHVQKNINLNDISNLHTSDVNGYKYEKGYEHKAGYSSSSVGSSVTTGSGIVNPVPLSVPSYVGIEDSHLENSQLQKNLNFDDLSDHTSNVNGYNYQKGYEHKAGYGSSAIGTSGIMGNVASNGALGSKYDTDAYGQQHGTAANLHHGYGSGYSANSFQNSASSQYHNQHQGEQLGADYYGHGNTGSYGAGPDYGKLTSGQEPYKHTSSFAYHKSWEHHGDPYVIKPVGEPEKLTDTVDC